MRIWCNYKNIDFIKKLKNRNFSDIIDFEDVEEFVDLTSFRNFDILITETSVFDVDDAEVYLHNGVNSIYLIEDEPIEEETKTILKTIEGIYFCSYETFFDIFHFIDSYKEENIEINMEKSELTINNKIIPLEETFKYLFFNILKNKELSFEELIDKSYHIPEFTSEEEFLEDLEKLKSLIEKNCDNSLFEIKEEKVVFKKTQKEQDLIKSFYLETSYSEDEYGENFDIRKFKIDFEDDSLLGIINSTIQIKPEFEEDFNSTFEKIKKGNVWEEVYYAERKTLENCSRLRYKAFKNFLESLETKVLAIVINIEHRHEEYYKAGKTRGYTQKYNKAIIFKYSEEKYEEVMKIYENALNNKYSENDLYIVG